MDFGRITACGESCDGCKKLESGICEGCRNSDGHCAEWKESGVCPIHACAREHDVLFCGLCSDFPCQRLLSTATWRKQIVAELSILAEEYHRKRDSMVPHLE